MRTDKFKYHLETVLSKYCNETIKILSFDPLSGGSINNAYRLNTESHQFFIKTNSLNKYPNMFETEAMGLVEISQSNSIQVPSYVDHGNYEDTAYLVLEYIDSKPSGDWQAFAINLAEMHHYKADNAGLSHNNYMGSLTQSNKQKANWIEFFISERLQAQLNIAGRLINNSVHKQFESLFKKMNQLIPEITKFSLLHGDLWSGNFIFNNDGKVYLIDPAVYYGNCEIDIAMTTLFGGFDPIFYDTYLEANPLETGWKSRLEVYNLYPLLIHLNLFGMSYLNSIKTILNKYS